MATSESEENNTMNEYRERLYALDATLASGMDRWSVPALRVAVGVVFIWFGALKLLGVSPAGDLVASTVYILPAEFFVPVLGVWEMIIGNCIL